MRLKYILLNSKTLRGMKEPMLTVVCPRVSFVLLVNSVQCWHNYICAVLEQLGDKALHFNTCVLFMFHYFTTEV